MSDLVLALPRSWLNSSGAMYATVPASLLLVVKYVELLQRASPKSAILATPPAVKSTFAGLRSRCTMPKECRYCRPRAMSKARASARRRPTRLGPWIKLLNVPAMSSSTMKMRGGRRQPPYKCTTFGCESRESSWNSRLSDSCAHVIMCMTRVSQRTLRAEPTALTSFPALLPRNCPSTSA